MSIIFKYTLFNLQGHIRLLQGHKVCTRTRYFNAWFKVFYVRVNVRVSTLFCVLDLVYIQIFLELTGLYGQIFACVLDLVYHIL